jgi:hypothetical protein
MLLARFREGISRQSQLPLPANCPLDLPSAVPSQKHPPISPSIATFFTTISSSYQHLTSSSYVSEFFFPSIRRTSAKRSAKAAQYKAAAHSANSQPRLPSSCAASCIFENRVGIALALLDISGVFVGCNQSTIQVHETSLLCG